MPTGATSARTRIATAVVLAAVAGFWILLTFQADGSVYSRTPLLDELFYLDRAAGIGDGELVPDTPYFMTPLYPWLVALSGAGRDLGPSSLLAPGDLRGLRLLQGLCWWGVFVLLRRIAGRTLVGDLRGWRREAAVWLPSLLFFLYRPPAIYGLSILLETPLLLLLTLALDLMLTDRWSVRRGVAIGLVLGLAALLRGTSLALLPIPLWAAWRAASTAGKRALAIGAVVLPLLVVLAPASIHNSKLAGRPAGPTLNLGLNLVIGNGAGAEGFSRTLWEGDWRRDPAGTAHLERTTGRDTVSVPEADEIWRRQAIDDMRERPARTAVLYLKKAWLYLQGWEIDQLVPLDGWTDQASLLRVLALPWRWLVVLALAGVGLLAVVPKGDAPRRLALTRATWSLALLVAAQSVFFVVSRYRMALVPVLCLLGGAALAHALWSRPAAAGWRRNLPLGLALLGLILTQPWGLGPVKAQWRAQADANLAHRWALVSEEDSSSAARAEAENLYLRAVRDRAGRPDWWLGLALVQREDGRDEEAAETLAEAVDLFPENLRLQKTLLEILLTRGRLEEARARAEALLAVYPEDADTLHNAAILLARSGDAAGAGDLARRLIAAHPGDPRGYQDLGVLLARSGDRAGAAEVFREGLRRIPNHPGLAHNLELVED